MFKTLEAKLIATYALVIALSLTVAGVATVAVVNAIQVAAAERFLHGEATVIARGIEWWLDLGRPLTQVRAQLQSQIGGTQHLFWLDADGRVIAHVRPPGETLNLEGQFLTNLPPRPAVTPAPTGAPGRRPIIPRLPVGPVNRIDLGPRTLVYAIVAMPRGAQPSAEVRPGVPAYVGLAQPVNELAAWPVVAWPLALIGLLAFALTSLLGVWLARSITGPLRQMTRASEAMAQGDYAQTIDVHGDDEVARLGQAFNAMSHEVDRAHRMQRDFVVNVSHDLKTPLTSIQGFAQAMTDGSLHGVADYQRAGGIIHAEAERMRRLIAQLIELARLQGGVDALAHAPVDVLSLLHSAGRLAGERATAAGLTFETELPAALPTVTGDAARLEQVVANVLDNALKYTPRGGRVTLRAGTAAGGVAVSVSDSGPGIPAEEQARVFERFFRGDRARAGDGGSGLGLAIAREIVEAHGGRIEVASAPGEGTTLRVWLPTGGGAQADEGPRTKDR